MGTRGLLGLIVKGKRSAAYNHYDSYPSALGKDIMNFILKMNAQDRAKMITHIKKIEWVQKSTPPSKEIQDKYSALGYTDLQVSEKTTEDWYALLRKVQGAKALPEILNGNLKHLVQSVEFLDDGLMCEWAYFVDFEEQIFETWASAKLVEKVDLKGLTDEGAKQYWEKIEKKAMESDDEPSDNELSDKRSQNSVD